MTFPLALCCMACLALALRGLAAEPQAAFYVSPVGNDAWSGALPAPNEGKTDGPFATVARAQQALRDLGPGAENRTVLLRGGTYRLGEPLVFTPEDSGSAEVPTVFAAYPSEMPVLSGGRAITGWTKAEGELWTATLPEVAAGQWYPQQLFVNGRRATRARTPNEGYFRSPGPLPGITNPQAERDNPETRIGFRYAEGDLKPWPDLADTLVVAFHSWTASLHWIDRLDEAEHTVRFTNPSGWPHGYWDRPQRFYVENYREALDAPGEWYLDRATGVLTYWPLPGEDMAQADVTAPALRKLVRFAGVAEIGMTVDRVVLRGLSFRHAEWECDRTEAADGQAAAFLEAAIVADGARSCTIEDCEIAHTGEYALWWRRGCTDCRVQRTEMRDLGAGGVRIGETVDPPANQASQRCVVDNCFIHDGGKVFPAGIGVWIGRSSYHEVTHNEICDLLYSGVSVGWSWGYAPSSAHHNRIESNHIHHLGWGVLSDMGGIYCLGISPGTVLRHNLIHDICSYSYGGWGLYTDEGSTDILLEGNVVYDTKSGGFHQHYGRENLVRNNVLAFSREGAVIRSREEEHLSFTFEGNIVLTDGGLPLGGNWSNGQFRMDRNLYWDLAAEDDLDFAGATFEAWQQRGFDGESQVVDPKFANAAARDFRLLPDSPALNLGFEPIDLDAIGLYGDPAWIGKAKAVQRPEMPLPRPPAPQPIFEDFETTPVGEQPRLDRISGEDPDKGASIRVTDETAATGTRCARITDAPGLDQVWQPHMYYTPNFARGKMHFAADLRLEPGAILWIEWRDAASPYHAGPSVRIEADGAVVAAGKTLLTVPLSEWLHLDIDCGLGKDSTGTYRLSVTLPDGTEEVFEDVPLASPEFRRLQWLGFVSLADGESALYLDNIELMPVK